MTDRWVKQTRFHGQPGGGNCTESCLASLLNIDLVDVPDLHSGESVKEYYDAFDAFVESRGFEAVRSDKRTTSGGVAWPRQYEGYYLATGPTTRFDGKVKHMVIMRDGKLVHDPHPDNSGLTDIEHTYVLVPLDPARTHD